MTDFASVLGEVQQFPDKPVITERELKDGTTVREFTIRSYQTQALVRISLFPEFGDVEVEKGGLVAAGGPASTREHEGKTYHNLTARTLAYVPPVAKEEYKVTNKKGGSAKGAKAPF